MFQRIGHKLKTLIIFLFDRGREEGEEDKALWASSAFTALSGRQIDAILAIVNEEVKRTKEQYGHTIRKEDALKEKCFFLLVFQNMGGIISLSKRVSFEEAQRTIYVEVEAAFREALKRYFDEWDGKGSRNWYWCHLQSVTNVLLHAIWSEEIT